MKGSGSTMSAHSIETWESRDCAIAGVQGQIQRDAALRALCRLWTGTGRAGPSLGVMSDALICDAVRTPIGRYGGALAAVRTDDLAAVPIVALLRRNPSLDPAAIEEVLL